MKKNTNKLCVITRGPSGSGKSTWIKNNLPTWSIVCSADKYHVDESGNYNWKPSNVKRSHEWCKQCFLTALQESAPVIVVDNTNIRHWEMKPYIDLAKEYKYNLRVVRLEVPLEKLIGRNVHNVPDDVVKSMTEKMEPWPNEEIYPGI